MKLLLITIFFLLNNSFLYSQSNNKSELTNKMHGYWLGEEYLKRIETTKSVFLNREYRTKIWGLTLDSTNLLSNSPYLNGFHVHEGGYGGYLFYDQHSNLFKSDSSKNEEFSAFYQDDFTLILDSNILTMLFSKNGTKNIFRKVVDEQFEFRKILFAPLFVDQNKNKIHFSEDGVFSGIENFRYFEVVYDFSEGINFAAILFFENKDDIPSIFKYEFKAGQLFLYKVKTNWENLERLISKKAIILTPVEN